MEELKIFTVSDWGDVKTVSEEMAEGCCRIAEAAAYWLEREISNG